MTTYIYYNPEVNQLILVYQAGFSEIYKGFEYVGEL